MAQNENEQAQTVENVKKRAARRKTVAKRVSREYHGEPAEAEATTDPGSHRKPRHPKKDLSDVIAALKASDVAGFDVAVVVPNAFGGFDRAVVEVIRERSDPPKAVVKFTDGKQVDTRAVLDHTGFMWPARQAGGG